MPIPSMSLLSPSESHAFQSFLTAMDYNDDAVAPEWYAHQRFVQSPASDDTNNEALAKATRDLMSLDPDRWNRSQTQREDEACVQPPPPPPYPSQQHPPSQFDQYRIPQVYNNTGYLSSSTFENSNQSRRRETFPFLKQSAPNVAGQQQQHQAQLGYFPNSGVQHHQPMLPPPTPYALQQNSYPRSSSSSSTRLTPTSSSSVSPSPSASTPSLYAQPSQPHITRPSLSPSISRRQPSSEPVLNTSAPASLKRSRSAIEPSPPPPPPPPGAKSTLLSPSQKKANHIQSEKKRRANIKRGYEALCESVPALREAIREEEMTMALENRGTAGSIKKSKKGKGREKGQDDGDDSEKIDGRAGPRSENVVLSKTIDYMSELLSERDSLLRRLEKARARLPASHPLLAPASTPPLWERQWKGGSGDANMEGPDAEDGDDDDEEGSVGTQS